MSENSRPGTGTPFTATTKSLQWMPALAAGKSSTTCITARGPRWFGFASSKSCRKTIPIVPRSSAEAGPGTGKDSRMTKRAGKAKKQRAALEEDWRELMLFSFGWLSGALDQLAQESAQYRAPRHLSCIFLARVLKGLAAPKDSGGQPFTAAMAS